MLVTSRAGLRLRAEYEYAVPPLALPEVNARFDAIERSEAVQLLVQRSRAVNRSCALTESSAPALLYTSNCVSGPEIPRRVSGASRVRCVAAKTRLAKAVRAASADIHRTSDVRCQTLIRRGALKNDPI